MDERERFPLAIDRVIKSLRRQTLPIQVANSLEEADTEQNRFASLLVNGALGMWETSITTHAVKTIVVGKDGQDSFFLGSPQITYEKKRALIIELQDVIEKNFFPDPESATYPQMIKRYIDRGQTIGLMVFGDNSSGAEFMFVAYPKAFAKIPRKHVGEPGLWVAMHFFRQHPGYTDSFHKVYFR